MMPWRLSSLAAGRRAPFYPDAGRRVALGLGCLLLAAAGCVRVPEKHDARHAVETTLFCATANGRTTLSWHSRTNMVYTVLVADRWNAMRWQPLPLCERQRGTGGVMEYTMDEESGRQRVYKLYAAPVAPPPR